MSEMIKIPDGWNIDQIGNILDIFTGDKDTQNKIEDGNYPFFVRSNTIERLDSYSFDGEAVLTAGDGVGVGKVFHHYDGKFAFHQRVYAIYGFNNDIDGRYFYRYFSKNFLKEVEKYSAKTSVDSVRLKMIYNMDILLPPIIEQLKIAEVLSEVDKSISKTEELFQKNKRLKTALMQDLLSYGVNKDGKVRNSENDKFKPSKLGNIPDEWDTEKLGNTKLFTLKTGGTPSTTQKEYWDNGSILWMSSGEVNKKVITDTEIKITEVGYKNSSATMIPKFSILMALAGQGKTRGTVAINHVKLSTNQSIAAITCNDKNISPQFLFYYLDSQYDNLRNISYGAGRAGLSLTILKGIEIIFPSLPEQQQIAQILSSQDEKIEDIKNKLNKLKSLKDSLMQDLLSGKKRVTKLMESN